MKKLEEKMLHAVLNRRNFKNTNTEVISLLNGDVFVKLYDTIIYAVFRGKEYFSDGGWNTNTTASRLRALGANYSTNEKKNRCNLTNYAVMNNMYFKSLFNIY